MSQSDNDHLQEMDSDAASSIIDQSLTDYESDSTSDSQESDVSDSSEENCDDDDDIEWERIRNEARERHNNKLEELVGRYEQEGETHETAEARAQNDLIPTYRKESRKVLFEYLKWMHSLRKNSKFRQIMKTKQQLMDVEGFGWEEALEAAICKRKFLLNKLFQEVPVQETIHDVEM